MDIDHKVALFLHEFSVTYGNFVYFLAELFPYVLGVVALFIALYVRKSYPGLSIALVTSVIVSRFLVLPLIRIFIERPRPFVSHEIFNPLFEPAGFSFPSGHATAFFALASVMFVWNKKIGIFFFVGALLISLSRISAGVHYPFDIIGGAILGMTVGFVVTRYIVVLRSK